MRKFKWGLLESFSIDEGNFFPWLLSRLMMQQALNPLEIYIDKVGLVLDT